MWGGCQPSFNCTPRGPCQTTHPDNPLYHGSKNPDGSPSSTLREDVLATCENIRRARMRVMRLIWVHHWHAPASACLQRARGML